jgi:hypothetical protein
MAMKPIVMREDENVEKQSIAREFSFELNKPVKLGSYTLI